MKLSERLQALRKQYRYSQKALAAELKGRVSQSTISQIEAEIIKTPRYDTISAIASVFGMNASQFLNGVTDAIVEIETDQNSIEKPLDIDRTFVLKYIQENPEIEDILLDVLIDSEGTPVSPKELEDLFRLAKLIYEDQRRNRPPRDQQA